ncbi:hypothetical protein [Hydrogenimonas sp.]
MNLRYSIDAFRTKQVLDTSYREESRTFETEKWWGEYDGKFDFRLVERILETFEKRRDAHFDLIHRSDYRDTYRSRGLGIDIYLKHYRVYEGKYSRTTIVKRNILRRNLAKKSFALTFTLRKLGIPTIRSLLYAGDRAHYISTEAIYVSLAEPRSVTLDYYIETVGEHGKRGSYTDGFDERIEIFDIDRILERYGRFCARLLAHGIRIYHRELFANTLLQPVGEDFRLLLCDLDTVNAISPFGRKEKDGEMARIRAHLKKRLEERHISADIRKFDEGAASWKR